MEIHGVTMTLDEVSAITDLHVSTIRRYIDQGVAAEAVLALKPRSLSKHTYGGARKYTEDQVRKIRAAYASGYGELKKLARHAGIPYPTAYSIALRRIYQQVE